MPISHSMEEEGDIKLVLFNETHAAELCKKAQDPTIWAEQRSAFHDPKLFDGVRLEKARRDMKAKKRYLFVIYYKGEIIGDTSFYDVSLKHLSLKIGYTWLESAYWGKGVNAAVKRLLLSYVFKYLKFKRAAFCVDADNLRSRAALENLGIPFEGILKKHFIRPDGTERNSAMYAMTDDVWFSDESRLQVKILFVKTDV